MLERGSSQKKSTDGSHTRGSGARVARAHGRALLPVLLALLVLDACSPASSRLLPLSASPPLVVTNAGDSTVSVVDTASNRVVSVQPAGPAPWMVAGSNGGVAVASLARAERDAVRIVRWRRPETDITSPTSTQRLGVQALVTPTGNVPQSLQQRLTGLEGHSVQAITADGEGRAYVVVEPLFSTDTGLPWPLIAKVDLRRAAVERRLRGGDVGDQVLALAAALDGTLLYVSTWTGPAQMKITAAARWLPASGVMSPRKTSGQSEVVAMEPQTGRAVARWRPRAGADVPKLVVGGHAGPGLYAVERWPASRSQDDEWDLWPVEGTLVALDGASLTEWGRWTLPAGRVSDLVISEDGAVAYVIANQWLSTEISALDLRRGAQPAGSAAVPTARTARINCFCMGTAVAGQKLYLSDVWRNQLWILDAGTLRVEGQVRVGRAPIGLAVAR